MTPPLLSQPFRRPDWVYEEKADGLKIAANPTTFGGVASSPTAGSAESRWTGETKGLVEALHLAVEDQPWRWQGAGFAQRAQRCGPRLDQVERTPGRGWFGTPGAGSRGGHTWEWVHGPCW